jgi:predicted CXXCH cytochrome family protein
VTVLNKHSIIKTLIITFFIFTPFLSSDFNLLVKSAHAAGKTEEKTEEERIEESEQIRAKANAKSSATIIYPRHHMVIFEQRDWIAGIESNAKIETVRIVVTSEATGEDLEDEEIEVESTGFFMYPVEYEPGINVVSVGEFTIDVYYQEDVDVAPPIEFKEMQIHQSVPDMCEECHDIFEEEKRSFPLNTENILDICDSCHKSRIYNRLRKLYTNVHKPVAEGKCTTCHDIHISKNERMLKRPQNVLCAESCHFKFIEKVKKNKFIHLGDMFDKICTKCHNPHSSNIKNLLRDVRKGICTKCHEAFSGEKEGVEYKSIHKPVVQGKCYLCHNIHSGKNKMYLIEEDAKTTCLNCHGEKVATGHGKKLADCTECHSPHISDKEGLFTDKGIQKCLSCHKELNFKKDVPQKSQCQLCHSPHSNLNVRIAKASCINCHEAEKLKPKHTDITPSYDECSKCHQLHGPGGKGLLKKNTHPLKPFKEKRCKACHQDKDLNTARNACYECHKDIYEEKHPQTIITPGVCIQCHKIHGGAGEKMIPEVQHKPFAERKCSECHTSKEVSKELPEKAKTAEICLGCHKTIDQDKDNQPYAVRHKPFEKKECVKCHETHASTYPKLTREDGHILCYTCHKSKEKDEAGEFYFSIHQPINTGDCLKCHYPHGSKYKSILKEDGKALCFTCHDNFLQKGGKMQKKAKGGLAAGKMKAGEGAAIPLYKTIHKPIKEKGCTACHNPHSADDKKLLTSDPGVFFCFKCHEDFTIDDEGYNKKSVHEPVLKGECVKCHDQHATDNPKLLRELPNKLCEGCHKRDKRHHKLRISILKKLTPIPEDFVLVEKDSMLACTNCHDPHSSDDVKLVRETKKITCKKCHSSVP